MGSEASFRDIDEFTTPAILDSDVNRFLKLQRDRESTAGLIVPVPKGLVRKHPCEDETVRKALPTYLAVVSSSSYDAALGFLESEFLQERLTNGQD